MTKAQNGVGGVIPITPFPTATVNCGLAMVQVVWTLGQAL